MPSKFSIPFAWLALSLKSIIYIMSAFHGFCAIYGLVLTVRPINQSKSINQSRQSIVQSFWCARDCSDMGTFYVVCLTEGLVSVSMLYGAKRSHPGAIAALIGVQVRYSNLELQ
jgi:hypothetical protein